MHLFRPDITHMLPRSRGATNIQGKNPSLGVPLYYSLNTDQDDEEITIDIRSDKGKLVKHFSSKESEHDKCIIKNMDPRSPFVTSGIRVGTPSITRRGFTADDARQLAGWMCDVLDNVDNEEVIASTKAKVLDICKRLPVYA